MATIPQHSGYQVIYGTSTGSNAHLVDTWIEYSIGEQYNIVGRVGRIITVYFYGALKDGYTSATSHENSLNTTLIVDGIEGETVSNGACDYRTSNVVNLYGKAEVEIRCDAAGGTIDVPIVGNATTHSTYISGGTINTTIPVSFTSMAHTITLSFDATGGTGAPASMSATIYGDSVSYTFTIPDALPVKTGYKCLGWASNPNIAEDWYPGDTIDVRKDTTLYAVWEPLYYELDVNGVLDGELKPNTNGYGTFDIYINGECVAIDATDYCSKHPYGTRFEIADVQPDTGKSYNGVTTGSLSGTLTENYGISLNFTTNTYTVTQTHYLPGGIGFQNTVDKVSYDTYFTPYTVTPPEGYSSKGATFNYYDANLNLLGSGTIGQNSFIVSGTHFVEVYYTAETYTVTYDANGGTGYMEPDIVTYMSDFITKPNLFEREGYIFNGWTDNLGNEWTLNSNGVYESGKGPQTWGYTENIILYAQWEPKNYSLTIQGYINGNLENGILGYGLYDVYINGEEYQLDCDDEFTVSLPYGSFYEIKNIRAEKTTIYNGVLAGNLSGTIDEDKIIILQFSTKAITTDLNVKVKANGQVKQGIKGVIKKDNQNKKIIRFYTKVNGIWKSK